MKIIHQGPDGPIVISDRVAALVLATAPVSSYDTAETRAEDLAHRVIEAIDRVAVARFSHQVADEVDDQRPDQTTYSRFALKAIRTTDAIQVDFDVRPVDASQIDLQAALAAAALAHARRSTRQRIDLKDDGFIRKAFS